MKKLLLMICAAVLLLSGCVASDTSVVFNQDKTIDVTVVYSIARNAGATDEAIAGIMASIESQLEGAEIDFSTSSDDDAYTLTVPLRFDSVDEMESSDYFSTLALIPRFNAEGIKIELNDNGDLTVTGVMNAKTLGFDSFINQAGLEPEKISARFAIETPDGTSGEWSVNGSEEAEISFEAKNIYGESKNYNSYIVIAIAAALVIAAAIIIVPKKPRKDETDERA